MNCLRFYRGSHSHGCGLGLRIGENSRERARAAGALAATVQSRMARASVARVMERAMAQENI